MLTLCVTWRRGDFRLQVDCALGDSVTAVYGPSGAGKTSLLHLICGLLQPASGRIVVGDQTLFDAGRGVSLPVRGRGIGMVFQDERLFPHLSVRGNLTYGLRRARGNASVHALQEVVELLEIPHLLQRRVAALSGGERRRVALGRALLAAPRLLLLDEPLAGLDQRLKSQILPFLRRACGRMNVPILLVSHELHDILQLTDQLLVLDRGQQVSVGPVRRMLADPAVMSVARRLGFENVLRVHVRSLPGQSLTPLALADDPGRTLLAPLCDAPDGQELYVAIRPEEIALATHRHEGLSIQNQIAGTVRRLQDDGGNVLVEVDIGCPLFAEISRRSAEDLGLRPGAQVHCLFKALGIRFLSGPVQPSPAGCGTLPAGSLCP